MGSCTERWREGGWGRSRMRCVREAGPGRPLGPERPPNLPRETPVRPQNVTEGLSGGPGPTTRAHGHPHVGQARSASPPSLRALTHAPELPNPNLCMSLTGRTVNRLIIWLIV